jgi:hypothetical protein
MGQASLFRLAVLRYGGGWNTRPTAPRTVLDEVERRTSVPVSPEPATVAAQEETIFSYPFLWMTGEGPIEPLPEHAVENLRRHLSFGGTLFADDTSGRAGSAFERSFAEQLERIFPTSKLQPLPAEHAVFRAYYYLGRVGGRKVVEPSLKGVTMGDRAAVIFSANDLSGALERGAAGMWHYQVAPPESENRTLALRLAVNLVIYALTVNYKLDQVHISYRLSNPQLYRGVYGPPAGEPAER